MKKLNKKWIVPLIAGGAVFALSLLVDGLDVLGFLERKTYDQRMVYASNYTQPNESIYFIGVNQESISWAQEQYGWSWPWPREAYARMIEFFSAGNANSIAFDILYSEPSIYGDSDDQILAQAEADSGIVIQTSFASTDNAGVTTVQEPIPVIRDSAALLGNITSFMDKDNIIRKGRLEYELDGKTYPTLGTAPLYLTDNTDLIQKAPRLKDGTILLRYQKNLDAYNPYWAKDILESYDQWKAGEESFFVPEDFEGAYIYTAYYAPGLFDICSTPVSQVFPGVGVHITTLDNLLSQDFMRKTPKVLEVMWMLILCLGTAFLVTLSVGTKRQRYSTIALIALFAAGTALSIGLPYLLFAKGIWLELACPVLAFLLSFLTMVIYSFATEGKQRRFIKSAFSQCLSKDVVNQILSDPSSFTLGGKKYQMTAIFTDIEKFSSFSELLTASQLGKLLNYYLTRMSDVIIQQKGTIDKYEGDAIVAFVGAPIEMEDHAALACRAAVLMKKQEILMNQEIREIASKEKPDSMDQELYEAFQIMVHNGKRLFTRVGINSGEMIAGYFGSETKKNYTMMGNNVNLASRLEGVNKQYHTGGILISENTRALIGNQFIVRSLDRIRVVNVNTPLRLYEVLEEAQDPSAETLSQAVAAWEEAKSLFENQEYKKALKAFTKIAEENPEDGVACYYRDLTKQFFAKGKFPTEADGVGVSYDKDNNVFNLLQK